MDVLIVSKTHMSNNACIGGIVLADNRYVRLLNYGNQNQPVNTDFEIGDIWDLNFQNRNPLLRPHVEDVIISSKKFVRRIENLLKFIENRNIVDWHGHINNVFEGLLEWTDGGAGYIPLEGELPDQSVGFWICNQNLIRTSYDTKTKYRYPNGNVYRNISFVGYQEASEIIPSGTLLRLSLSRAFPSVNSNINVPRGYYLQLSGWYDV